MMRLKPRTWVVLGIVGVLLALASAVSRITREGVAVAAHYERLAIGMNEAEVEAAVTLPPGDHTGDYEHTTTAPVRDGGLPPFLDYHPWANGAVTAPHPVTGRPLRGRWWRGGDGLVIVFYGDDGCVAERRYYPGSSRSWARCQVDLLFP